MSMLMCIQYLVRFCQFVFEILSGNEILTSIKGRNSIKIFTFSKRGYKNIGQQFLARLYESTGRAIAVTPASASALASALLKMLKFLVKVFMSLYLLKL